MEKERHDSKLIFALNAGSSSLKFALINELMNKVLYGLVSEIGKNSILTVNGNIESIDCTSHKNALEKIFTSIAKHGISMKQTCAVGHRIVHGGVNLTAPMRVTSDVIAEIRACQHLAPLHNPHNLSGINAIADIFPELPQIACFDTAFHSGNPAVATSYALPINYVSEGFRRFGFHGLSYSSIVETLPKLSGHPLPGKLLAFHLGNGASECAIVDGKSVATTMGYSPLGGLTMGTRLGDIDGIAVLRLAESLGIAETESLLNERSGLAGLACGKSNMAELLASQAPEAKFAVEHFCYWAVRHAGSMIAAMGGLDAIAFTGGIGENAHSVRSKIIRGLSWLGVEISEARNRDGSLRIDHPNSRSEIWIVPADEEKEIARHVVRALG